MLALQTRNEAEFIHPNDPALNTSAEGYDWENFANTGDRGTLRFHDGQVPTVLKVRKLTRKQFEHIKRQQSEGDLVREVVSYSLVGVENLRQPGALQLGYKTSDLGPRLSETSYDEVFAWDLLLPLSLFVMSLSNLTPTKGQR